MFRKKDVIQMQAQPCNVACQNLLRHNKIPTGTPQLLGLCLNYYVKPISTREMTIHTFYCLATILCRMYALRDVEKDGKHIRELYLKSDYNFDHTCQRIELGPDNFKTTVLCKLLLLHRRHHLKPRLTLPPLSFRLMQHLKNHNMLIVVH